MTVALWSGPAAREKRNLYLSFPLVSGGVPVAATQVTLGLLRLGRGVHLFGSTGHRFDGKRVLDGSALLDDVVAPSPLTRTTNSTECGASTTSGQAD
ncbi:hypothetical protein ACIG3E_38285 [Streptomyces sp. NPDC053474]|uniref:hypothetical protein n=1 Tax=Streptomyces sp. NPDC053474 TaxID=3365704 RepID=UPI0037D54BC8